MASCCSVLHDSSVGVGVFVGPASVYHQVFEESSPGMEEAVEGRERGWGREVLFRGAVQFAPRRSRHEHREYFVCRDRLFARHPMRNALTTLNGE